MSTKAQHTTAIIGVIAYTFLASYITTPSVMSFLHTHAWLADIVGSLIAAYHVYQTYSGDGKQQNPQPPAEPAKEQ